MTELQNLLVETTARVLADSEGSETALAWSRVAQAGLPTVLAAEDKGGFGGRWEDALLVVRAAGAHATALPLPEAILGSGLIAEADLILPDEMLTVATSTKGRVRTGKLTGEMRGVPFGTEAASVAGIIDDRTGAVLVVAERSDAEVLAQRENPAGEPRADLQFEGANVQAAPLRGWSGAKLFRFLALMRAGQIAGALESALSLAVTYTRERQQFGKPLAGFQAIQQQLAVLAEETAAAGAAVAAAARAADRGEAQFEIAAAKLRANQAAAVAAGIAHQVHGAMGFTKEYRLHLFTRRLWAWRSEFGNDRHWAEELGARIAARGADRFWDELISPS